MTTPVVVDASVLVKLFLQEPDSQAARALIGGGRALLGPEHVTIEVASAMVRRFRSGGLTRGEAEQALAAVRQFFLRGSFALTPDADLLARAEEIALDLKQALKDCLYVALAERAGAVLVTTDATLLARAAPRFAFVTQL
jgi:predicted nucleic acid-binding protein